MKILNRMLAVALVLAVTIMFAAAFAPMDAMAAAAHGHGAMSSAGGLHDIVPYLAAPLTVLRADLDGLIQRAADKMAELKEDTPSDQARTISDDHKKIVADIEAKRAEIAEEEKAEAERAANPNANQNDRAEANRAADVLDIGTRSGMGNDLIQEAIRSGMTVDAFRVRAFDFMVARQSESRTDNVRIITDERETTRNASAEALAYRMGAPLPQAGPSAGARGRMDHGMIRVAMECTGVRQYPETARAREELFERAAHSTSDFPIIMENAMNRTLEARYRLSAPTYRQIARQRNFRDFRPHTIIKTGDFPMLQQILEGGEIKYGTLTEGKETLSVLSYGRALSVTRQLMINDDLGAIQDMLSDYGQTVALFEEITFYSQALNGKLADGQNVFHASHNNLAGSGAAIDVTTVSAGRAAMAKQKSIDGNPLMANAPAIILTGPDRITSAEMLVASITPATLASVNIFSGRLQPMDTAQITGNDWYLFPRPEVASNYRWGYLEGYEAPRIRVENPFGRQGMAMSVEHDFGCGPVDYRYGWKNPGA